MRHRHLIALACGMYVAGCEVRPTIPVLRHGLNAKVLASNEDLADDRVAQDQLRGALDMLFGSPAHPGYFVVEEWVDEEFNPSYGSYELSEEAWEALLAENEKRFADQLARIESGDFGGVRVPSHALDLAAEWDRVAAGFEELQEAIEEGTSTDADLAAYVAEEKGEAKLLFSDWYPSLRESSELYRVQCLHCHGTSGGGDGPTAEFLTPRPRDYRPGMFKYTALNERARPRRADLLNLLEQGVYGTAMPNFQRFSAAELNGLVDYVRLLSIRGETEIRLAVEYDPNEGIALETVQETYLDVWEAWKEASRYVIAYEGEVPRATPESIAHGKQLFNAEDKANCVSCHGAGGRGDGASAFERDEEGELVRVKDDWGNEIFVRDLTRGLYRFGSRPIDLFRRIYAGINGTPMPSHAAMKDPNDPDARLMSDEDLWSIVHYIQSIPFERGSAAAAPPTGSAAGSDTGTN